MFGRKKEKKKERKSYDPARWKPVLRCSICTGEQVAGFRDLQTGKFEEVTLIKSEDALWQFLREYGLTEIAKEY